MIMIINKNKKDSPPPPPRCLYEITPICNGVCFRKVLFKETRLENQYSILIQDTDPRNIWDFLYDMLGLPERIRSKKVEEKVEKINLENFTARELLLYIKEMYNITPNISIKSKKSILRFVAKLQSEEMKCLNNKIYSIKSPKGHYGIYHEESNSFLIAIKEGETWAFIREYHINSGPPYGVVTPVECLSEEEVNMDTLIKLEINFNQGAPDGDKKD